jgi:hypothetical protein
MKRFLLKAADVIGGGFIYLAGGLLAIFAAIGGAGLILLSIVLSCAVPAFCVIAAWGILKYFGVI